VARTRPTLLHETRLGSRASTAGARESRTAANTPQSTEINRTAHPPYPFGSEPDLRKGERVSGRSRKVEVSRQWRRRAMGGAAISTEVWYIRRGEGSCRNRGWEPPP